MHTSTFWLKFGSLSPAVTLKIRSSSPKPNQLSIMSQCYTHANLVKIHPPVHEVLCKQESVMLTPTGSHNMSPSHSVGDIIILLTQLCSLIRNRTDYALIRACSLITTNTVILFGNVVNFRDGHGNYQIWR